ncbi:MAG: glycosyltransferase [Fimbriimonadaceae bacterium]
MPRVSVCLAVFNGAASLRAALDSVRFQTYTDYELVVLDDGSTDGSGEIATEFGARLISQKNEGLGAGRKRMVEEAKGDLIAFIDHDDEWLPDKLRLQIPLHDDPSVVLSHTAGHYEHEDGRKWDRKENIPAGTPALDHVLPLKVIASSVVFSRQKMLEAGNFVADVKICSDWYGWLILSRMGSFRYLSEPTVKYRIRAGANSEPGLKFFEAERYVIEERFLPDFGAFTPDITDAERAHYRSILRKSLGRTKRTIAHFARLSGDRNLAMRMHREAIACDPLNVPFWLSWVKNGLVWRPG